MSSVDNPLIVFGTGRSGSTVLMEALFRHKSLGYIPSLLERRPDQLWINMGRHLFDNPLYRVFGQKPQLYKTSLVNKFIFKPAEGYPVWEHLLQSDDFARSFLMEEGASTRVKARVRTYFKSLLQFQGRERLALKYTGPARLHYVSSIFPEGSYLRLTRSFIPTLHSFLKVPFWNEQGIRELWWQGGYSESELLLAQKLKHDPVVFTAFQLKKVLDLTESELQTLDLDVMEGSYEDFVSSSEAFLEEVLHWCGLPMDPACFKYLRKNKMVNRNKAPEEYFDAATLQRIEEVLGVDPLTL